MMDQRTADDKIIGVHVDDPEYRDYRDLGEVSEHRLAVVKRFFDDYKALERKAVQIERFVGAAEARAVIARRISLYAARAVQRAR